MEIEMEKVIVSRHVGAIEFIRAERAELADVPVLASATAEDVKGKVVFGNLPMNLAALAAEVWAIEFVGAAPRGSEYTLADMRAAGAQLVPYIILDRSAMTALREKAHSDGYGPNPWCLVHFSDE
jgi:putative CRISPR-associated protein (TIGR02620 family)